MMQGMGDKAKPILVGLMWHSMTSDNMGVLALTASQVEIIERAAAQAGRELKIRVFGTFGTKPPLDLGPQCEQGPAFRPKRMLLGQSDFYRQVRECDVLFDIGEGDSFTDIYGMHRFVLQIGSKLVALATGKPLILSPQTIGPFESAWTRGLAAWVMRRCARVYARDQISKKYLQTLGVDKNADEAIDVAFLLPFIKPVSLPDNGGKIRVGVNVSGLMLSGGYTGANQFGLKVDYPALVRTLLERLLARGDVNVFLVPHVLSDSMPEEDDYRASIALAVEFPGVTVSPKFSTPSEAKSFISGLDFFTGARMHSCVAAFSAGVPVVPMAYSRKFIGLFSSIGYDWVADCREHNDQEVIQMVLDGLERRQELLEVILEANGKALAKLARYEAFLAGLIKSLP